MELLKITNFLCIEHAEIEIKKINLFIGEQAQGKSVIAKLIYFFKSYPQTIFELLYSSYEYQKEDFNRNMRDTFEKIFPKYTWEKTEFNINYSTNYYDIFICNKKISKNQFHFELINNKKIDDIFINSSKRTRRTGNSLPSINEVGLRSEIISFLFKEKTHGFIEKGIYIPAGRSFFANLEKNSFSLIRADIDFFLKEFGMYYQYIKNYRNIMEGVRSSYKISTHKKLIDITYQLIKGQFLTENEQDWIVTKQGKIAVIHSSSGQQEVLPVAFILSKCYMFNFYDTGQHFIIEEPEAHLFPIAQSQIVSLITLVYNHLTERYVTVLDNDEIKQLEDIIYQRQNSFTITTHSPYILTAFNNLIQAGNVAKSKNYQDLDELYKVVSEHELINFDDVSAYFVEKGTVKSILDHELKLIDAHAIDSISRQFAQTFEKLVMMEENHD